MAWRTVLDVNVWLSQAIARRLRLPTDKTLWRRFEEEAATLIHGLPDGATVLDLGGGGRCVCASAIQRPGRPKLAAADISPEELAENTDVSETYVADVTEGQPVPTALVELIVSRALLEHVADVSAAIRRMARVLAPGGVALHLVPCRYSLFGTAARLPSGLAVNLTSRMLPWLCGLVWFPVHYDHCFPQALESEFRSAGFSEVRSWVTWAQPGYFEAIYPLFLLHAGYEFVTCHLRIRRLAAYTVVRAVR